MTLKEILSEIYTENRKLIRVYVILALLLSFFMFYVAESKAALISYDDTVSLDTAAVGVGGPLAMAIQSASDTVGLSIDPAIMMSFVAGASILNDYDIWLEGVPVPTFGVFSFWWARILVFSWALFALSPTIFGAELEEINTKYVGPICLLVLEVATILQSGVGVGSYAADEGVVAYTAVSSFFLAVFEFIKIIILYLAYFCIRFMIFGLDILINLLSQLNPGVSSVFKFVKIGVAAGYIWLANAHPYVFLVLGLILVVIAFFVFKWAYKMVRYFKYIYIRPFFLGIFKRKVKQPLIFKKAPKKLVEHFNDKELKLLIPAFAIKNSTENRQLKKHDRWWLAITEDGSYIVKKKFLSKKILSIPLKENGEFNKSLIYKKYNEKAGDELYIRKASIFRGSFCEIFSSCNIEKNATKGNKYIRIVFSKEYMNQFEDIKEMFGFADYDILRKEKQVGFLWPWQKRKLKAMEKALEEMEETGENSEEVTAEAPKIKA